MQYSVWQQDIYLGTSVTHNEASEADHTVKPVKTLLKKLSFYLEKKPTQNTSDGAAIRKQTEGFWSLLL